MKTPIEVTLTAKQMKYMEDNSLALSIEPDGYYYIANSRAWLYDKGIGMYKIALLFEEMGIYLDFESDDYNPNETFTFTVLV